LAFREMSETDKQHSIIIETAGENFSAHAPDLPGCVATGATEAAVNREIRAAIEFHLDGL